MTFKGYLQSFSAAWKTLTALAVIVAALLKFTPLVPPWPDEGGSGASGLAVAACVLGIVIAYQSRPASQKRRSLVGVTAMTIAAIFLIAYVYLTATRVVSIKQPIADAEVTRRVVVGTELRNPADSGRSPEQLLQLYGLDASAWTVPSLAASRLTLLSVYMGFYLAMTFGIGVTQGPVRK